MNENSRTGIFCGVAIVGVLLVLVVGWLKSPSVVIDPPDAPIVSSTYSPLSVTSLEIVKYDASLNKADVFKVAQVDGVWCVPSRYNYPTDSENNPLATVAGSIRGLKQLGVVSDNRADHAQYEVVEPDPAKNQAGEKGIGTKITMLGADGKPVVSLIIGKAVKDKPQLRYVRVPERDRVYEAKINADAFPTRFEEWINPDLLKVNSWDIKKFVVEDYSVDITEGSIIPKGKFELSYEDSNSKKEWKLSDLASGEVVNEQRLNDATAELGKLKIVDVRPKPTGVGPSLALADGLTVGPDDRLSLGQGGFYIAADERGFQGLFSQQGERQIIASDGVVYTLRFGAVTSGKGGGDAKAPVTDNRYLLITVRHDESMVPKPDLKPLPGEDVELTTYSVRELKQMQSRGLIDGPEIEAQRKQVEADNKKLLDEWESKIKPGREKAEKLARRFGKWYYIISDDVFKKIHFSREDILKKPGAEDAVTPEGAKPGEPLPPAGAIPGFPGAPPK